MTKENKNLSYIHERFGGQCNHGDIAPYVLVPGSQRRVRQLSENWEDTREVALHYEFLVMSGTMNGIPISACSTGIGGRSTSIAIDETSALGAHTYIRVGVTGSLQPEVKVGDLIISTGSVRMDKTSNEYAPLEYPAVANFEVVLALIEAAEKNNFRYHVGIGATSSSFYCGEGTSGYQGYRTSEMDNIVPDLQVAKVFDWDTESATLFTIANIYGLRAGRINAVVDDPETGFYNPIGEKNAIKTSLDAMMILAERDIEKEISGRRYILPPFPAQN